MAKREGVLIQIRVPEAEAEALREAAEQAGRSLPAEMRYRLNAYQAGEEASVARAMGTLSAQIASDVEAQFATSPGMPPELLGTIRDATVLVLNGMGAEDPSDQSDEFSTAKFVAFRVLRWLRSAVRLPDEPPAIRRIRGVLMPRQGD